MCIEAATALSLGSGALGAIGSLASGSANSAAAGIQAKVAEANSQMALDEGAGRVAQIGQRVDRTIGTARANAGAANLAINSGSPLMVQAMDAQQGNTDKQLAMAGALNQAGGQSFAASSALQRQSQDQMAGEFGAATSLMRGLGGIRGLGGVFGPGSIGAMSSQAEWDGGVQWSS